MEDLFVDEEKLKELQLVDMQAKQAVDKLMQVMKNRLRSNFEFLCCLRKIIECSSNGSYILKGNVSMVNYSWIECSYSGVIESRFPYNISVVDYLNKLFGFSKQHIEYLVKIINKFLRTQNVSDVGIREFAEENGTACCVGLSYAFDFLEYLSISKMQELLPLSMEQIQKAFDNKELTVRSTVQDIRKYIKAVKGGTSSKVLEETPTAVDYEEERPRNILDIFSPTKKYDTTFFNDLEKSELITCCLLYQKEYVKD